MKIQKVRWAAFYLVSLLVLTSAVVSPEQLPAEIENYNSSLAHVLIYLVLTVVSIRTFQFTKAKWLASKPNLTAVLYSSLMGVFTEVFQFYVPGRYCDLMDLLMNAIGIVVGFILVFIFGKVLSVFETTRTDG